MRLSLPAGVSQSRNPFLLAVRWILVLPSGIVMAMVISFPFHWLIMLSKFFLETFGSGIALPRLSLPAVTLEHLAQAFVTPWSLVYFGYRMAPAFRLHVASAIVLLYAVFLGAMLMQAAFVVRGYAGWGWLEFAGVIMLGLAGAVKGLYSSYQRFRQGR